MAFGDAIADVISRCKRPDKLADIKGAINAAIAFFSSYNFDADLVELPNFAIDGQLYAQSFPINTSPFVNFKVISYIRPSGYRRNLAWRDPKHIFANGCESLDVWYRSGHNIIFKLSSLQSELKLGYISYHPILVDGTDTDWMLDEMNEAVIQYALSPIMKSIGEDAESNNNLKTALFLVEAYKNATNPVQG